MNGVCTCTRPPDKISHSVHPLNPPPLSFILGETLSSSLHLSFLALLDLQSHSSTHLHNVRGDDTLARKKPPFYLFLTVEHGRQVKPGQVLVQQAEHDRNVTALHRAKTHHLGLLRRSQNMSRCFNAIHSQRSSSGSVSREIWRVVRSGGWLEPHPRQQYI